MKKISFKNIWDLFYNTLLIITLSSMVGYSCLYIRSIKDDIKNITDRQQELYDNDVLHYNTVQREINLITLYMAHKDGEMNVQIQAAIAHISEIDKRLAFKLAQTYKELQLKINNVHTTVQKINDKPSYNYLKSITVGIYDPVKDSDKGSLGTGVIVKITKDFTYILTNHHVIDNCSDERDCVVFDEEINKYPLEIVKISANNYDLALVKISGQIPTKIPVIGINEVSPQDKVFMVGHHDGRQYLYSEGVVAGYGFDGSLVVELATAPGNSGSGVINQKGELVGLIFAINIIPIRYLSHPDFTHGECVNSKVIKLFLADILS